MFKLGPTKEILLRFLIGGISLYTIKSIISFVVKNASDYRKVCYVEGKYGYIQNLRNASNLHWPLPREPVGARAV